MPPKRAALSLDDKLGELKVSELRELREQNMLERDGDKSELIERLEQHRKGKRRCRAGPCSEKSSIRVGNKRGGSGLGFADLEARISLLKRDLGCLKEKADARDKRITSLGESVDQLAAEIGLLKGLVALRVSVSSPPDSPVSPSWGENGTECSS